MNRIIGLILIMAFQVVILNHLELTAYLYPQVFILILINLPPFINKSYQVLLAFALGLIADFFTSTPGLHASACMFLALLRIGLLNRYDIEEVKANRSWLNLGTMAMDKYIFLSAVLVLFYHLYAFGLESMGALNSVYYFITVGLSSLVSFVIILLIQYLFIKRSV